MRNATKQLSCQSVTHTDERCWEERRHPKTLGRKWWQSKLQDQNIPGPSIHCNKSTPLHRNSAQKQMAIKIFTKKHQKNNKSANPRMTCIELQTSLAASEIKVHASTIRQQMKWRGTHGRVESKINTAYQEKNLWVEMWRSGPAFLLPFMDHSGIIQGTLNSQANQQILDQNLLLSARELNPEQERVQQQDNDHKHSSKTTKEWLRERSLDLNSVSGRSCPSNLPQLADWAKIPKSRCKTLVNGYRRCLVEVMAAKWDAVSC